MKEEARTTVHDETPDVLDLAARRFRVLGHPVRLRLLELLTAGPQSVSGLVKRTGLEHHQVSKHICQLHHAELVTRTQRGNHAIYALAGSVTVRAVSMVCTALRDQRIVRRQRVLGARDSRI